MLAFPPTTAGHGDALPRPASAGEGGGEGARLPTHHPTQDPLSPTPIHRLTLSHSRRFRSPTKVPFRTLSSGVPKPVRCGGAGGAFCLHINVQRPFWSWLGQPECGVDRPSCPSFVENSVRSIPRVFRGSFPREARRLFLAAFVQTRAGGFGTAEPGVLRRPGEATRSQVSHARDPTPRHGAGESSVVHSLARRAHARCPRPVVRPPRPRDESPPLSRAVAALPA